jgi:hypothetical protein
MGRLFKIADDFYPDPDLVREIALRSTYHFPRNYFGYRSTKGFLPRGTVERIQALFGFERVMLHRAEWGTTCFYQTLARGRHRESFFVHIDAVRDPRQPRFAFLVYLSPQAPPGSGTGIYRHKATGLWQDPTAADARRLGRSRQELRDRLEADAQARSRWELLDSAENAYNRAVLFPSHWYHAGGRYFGSRVENGRLYQAFFFHGHPDVFAESPRDELLCGCRSGSTDDGS